MQLMPPLLGLARPQQPHLGLAGLLSFVECHFSEFFQYDSESVVGADPGKVLAEQGARMSLQHQPSLEEVPKSCHIPGRGCREPISAVWLCHLFPVEADSSVPGCKSPARCLLLG